MGQLSDLEKKRDLTRAALTEKLNALEDRVRTSIEEARETVKRTVDLQYQFEKRPLVILGCSALVGYFLGRVWLTGSGRGEPGAENEIGSYEGKVPSNDSSKGQAGVLKGALSAAMSNLLVDLIKEMVPRGTEVVENKVESEPQVSPDAEKQTENEPN
jgi:hypothetical protein